MKQIELTKGYHAIVDDEDFDVVSKFLWFAIVDRETVYARSYLNGGTEQIALHNFIMNPPEGLMVDHKDRNGLNCSRSNLRLCTRSQNNANRAAPQGEFGSGYRGVYEQRNGRFQAKIKVEGVSIPLGTYDVSREAAKAYDAAALLHYGEFASLNFPEEVGWPSFDMTSVSCNGISELETV